MSSKVGKDSFAIGEACLVAGKQTTLPLETFPFSPLANGDPKPLDDTQTLEK